MDKDDVINLVYSRQDTLVGKTIGSLHLSEIENLLSQETLVKNAEAYVEKPKMQRHMLKVMETFI